MRQDYFVAIALLGRARTAAGYLAPWPDPTKDVYANVQPPHPTGSPSREVAVELVKRDMTVPPNLCGWINGNYDDSWAVVGATCFFNSDLKIVNGFTTCYESTAGVSVPTDCSIDCKVCEPDTYCGTAIYPDGYRGHGNCQTAPGIDLTIDLTFTGQTVPVDIPIYTGSDGISTGTQYPPETTAAATGGAAGSNGGGGSSTNVGAIVGGVVGGVAVIGIVAVVIALLIYKTNKRKAQAVAGPESIASLQPPTMPPADKPQMTAWTQLHSIHPPASSGPYSMVQPSPPPQVPQYQPVEVYQPGGRPPPELVE